MRLTLLLSFLLLAHCSYSQTKTAGKSIKIDDQKIYFVCDNKEIAFFTKKNTQDSKRWIKDKVTLFLTDTYANLYFKWLNPIRYQFNWKDTTYIDNRDQALSNYFSVFIPQFGTTISDLNKSTSAETVAKMQMIKLSAPQTNSEKDKVQKSLIPEVIRSVEVPKTISSLEIASLYYTCESRVKTC